MPGGPRVTIDGMHTGARAAARLGFAIVLLLCVLLGSCQRAVEPEYRVIFFDAQCHPHIECLAGRLLAETDPRLTARERGELWNAYGLRPSFERIVEESGFTYHELEVFPLTPLDYARWLIAREPPPPRDLPSLVALLNDDPRIHWAAPDALLLEWGEPLELPPGEELIIDEPVEEAGGLDVVDAPLEEPIAEEPAVEPEPPAAGGLLPEECGVNFVDEHFRPLQGGLSAWIARGMTPNPIPDFEYYRLCSPQGTAVPWADVLAASPEFMERCSVAYGTGQARALQDYVAAGSPLLAPITICVADTGIAVNHLDFAGRLHPNSIDANYRNYEVARAGDRPAPDEEITDRDDRRAIGLPRPAIQQRPAAHGTAVTGIVTRCTAGFETVSGPLRILPASIKSERALAFVGGRIKSPISSFIKLVVCLSEQFPTGETNALSADIENRGDVRVVTLSASVPKSYFGDAEWRLIAPAVGKAAGSIAEDLRQNDRVYLLAAGNDAQGEPGRPGEMDYIVCVAATSTYDGTRAWAFPLAGEGSSLGMKCVSAPGDGIITSLITPQPNLSYLPEHEFRAVVAGFSIPPREGVWEHQTYGFSATSSATPQVAALAALLYAQDPSRDYRTVIGLIEDSTAGREVHAEWGSARGLIDFAAALSW